MQKLNRTAFFLAVNCKHKTKKQAMKRQQEESNIDLAQNRAISKLAVSGIRQDVSLYQVEQSIKEIREHLYLMQATLQESRIRLAQLETRTEGTNGSLSKLEEDLDKLEEEVEGQGSLALHAKKEVVSSTIGFTLPIALAFLLAIVGGIAEFRWNPIEDLLTRPKIPLELSR
jgi:small-conductance mechanosensitive channel